MTNAFCFASLRTSCKGLPRYTEDSLSIDVFDAKRKIPGWHGNTRGHWWFAVAASALFLTACGPKTERQHVELKNRPVKLIEVNGANSERNNRYPAIIEASESSTLSFQVGGKIDELPVDEAQTISAGDLIARLEQGDFQSRVASARATHENAEADFQRATRLIAQDAIATSVLEQRRSQRDIAKAQLELAEKALRDSEIRAPFSGVVASVPVRRLQTVTAGTNVATVINRSILDAVINLPASVISRVPTGEDRRAVVLLEAAPGREITAIFKKANLVADATSQTYSVAFSFDAPEDLVVLPGMNASVVLRSASNAADAIKSVAIPLAAVQGDGSGQYVWIVDQGKMTVSRRDIEIEPGIGETVLVRSGLSTGDQIVGAGGAYLSDGAQVTPWVP